jgi:hypothetical protein
MVPSHWAVPVAVGVTVAVGHVFPLHEQVLLGLRLRIKMHDLMHNLHQPLAFPILERVALGSLAQPRSRSISAARTREDV